MAGARAVTSPGLAHCCAMSSDAPDTRMTTGRMEAFSDGVIAVAITLLVLDLTPPEPNAKESLAHALAELWPNYLAYVVSFVTIGIIWINHHISIRRLAYVDQSVLALNLLLLLTVVALPFTTALMARYLTEPAGARLAAAVYGGSYLVMGLTFFALQRHMVVNRQGLLRQPLDDAARRRVLTRNGAGLIPYAVATAVAPLSQYLTLAICGAVAVYYALPTDGRAGRSARRSRDAARAGRRS